MDNEGCYGRMNRAERRRLERKGVNQGSIMQRYGSEAYDSGYKKGMSDAIEIMFYMTAWAIQARLDFGPKRLQRIMKQIFENIDCYRTGHLYPEDFPYIKSEMQKIGINLVPPISKENRSYLLKRS